MRMRMRVAAAGVAGLVVVLSGCAGIPTGGPVGSAVIDLDSENDLVNVARGPQKGDDPEQLLAGFLRAQRAPQGDYDTARQFLTDEFRSTWSPTERVLISDSSVTPLERDEDTFEATVHIDAIVNGTGNYSELAEPQSENLVYEFERDDDDEWRISSAPAGTILSSSRFENAFAPSPLYFYDPTGTYLVPDLRWFPDIASRGDRIVTELLRGQSPWYANGVLVTAFPAETTLGTEGVTVTAGQATVDLSNGVAAQPLDARWRMQQQLVASLATLSDVGPVQLTVGGFPIQVGDGEVPDRVLSVSPVPAGLTDDGFGELRRDDVQRIAGLSGPIEDLGALGATLARGRTGAAVRTAGGVWLVSSGSADPVLVDARAGLIDPGLDGLGYAWTAVASDPGSIVAVDADGSAHPLPKVPLEGTIVALEVSRDGTRLLVATRGAGGSAVAVVGIVRDADGVPFDLGEPLALTVGEGRMLDAAWVDSSSIATLSSLGGDALVDLFRIGGRHENLGAVSGGVQLIGGDRLEGIRVRDGDDMVWRRNSSGGWQAVGVVASFLATQQ